MSIDRFADHLSPLFVEGRESPQLVTLRISAIGSECSRLSTDTVTADKLLEVMMIFENHKVLVCDDQPMLRKLLSSAIRNFSAKYEVVEAPNGAVAEQLLRTQEFYAVFMDVEMPEQDGFTTLEKIRAEDLTKGAPVVMCTGCGEDKDLIRGWQLEVDYYLTKPFDLDEIDSVLNELDEKGRAVA